MKRKTKSLLSLLLAAVLAAVLITGCSSAPSGSSASGDAVSDSSAPLDETDAPTEKVLLAVSFGTSYDDSRDVTIGAVENALQGAFPDYEVRRAFTSQIIIDILAGRGLEIDNVTEAMDRLVADGIKEVIIQPTHIMAGYEYDDVMAEIATYADKFDSFKVGSPLLISDEDYAEVAAVLADETASYNAENTAILFMGHGTHHEANATYAKMQQVLSDAGYSNYFVGTVEGGPLLEDVLPLIEASGAEKIVMLPLMVVAGDHANNDMAGDEEDSWKSILESEGYQVECVLKGLGQYPGIQEIYVKHAQAAEER